MVIVDAVSKPNTTKQTAASKVMIHSEHLFTYYSLCISIGLYMSPSPKSHPVLKYIIVPLYIAYHILHIAEKQ
jgi:hypothetical protein